jgi:hypothetical protein
MAREYKSLSIDPCPSAMHHGATSYGQGKHDRCLVEEIGAMGVDVPVSITVEGHLYVADVSFEEIGRASCRERVS